MSDVTKLKQDDATSIASVATGPHVYTAIAEVMKTLAREGITKDRTNTQPGANYKFRGVDDVYNALSAILAENRLCIIPRVLSRECIERLSSNGKKLLYTTVEVEFDLISAVDGSKHTAKTVGEAMDSGDKSSNKAMSAAYKYMAFQTFCIPTEGDNDADATTHQLASAEEMAVNLLRGCADKALFKEAWEKNKGGWQRVMDGPAYARVVAEMKRLAANFQEPEPSQQTAPAEDFGLSGDDIPDFGDSSQCPQPPTTTARAAPC